MVLHKCKSEGRHPPFLWSSHTPTRIADVRQHHNGCQQRCLEDELEGKWVQSITPSWGLSYRVTCFGSGLSVVNSCGCSILQCAQDPNQNCCSSSPFICLKKKKKPKLQSLWDSTVQRPEHCCNKFLGQHILVGRWHSVWLWCGFVPR